MISYLSETLDLLFGRKLKQAKARSDKEHAEFMRSLNRVALREGEARALRALENLGKGLRGKANGAVAEH